MNSKSGTSDSLQNIGHPVASILWIIIGSFNNNALFRLQTSIAARKKKIRDTRKEKRGKKEVKIVSYMLESIGRLVS